MSMPKITHSSLESMAPSDLTTLLTKGSSVLAISAKKSLH